jgi:transcriptional pleiotropic regulator of transition state genes
MVKKTLGIVRNIDHLGRIVLPMELRKTREINPGDPIEIYTEGDVICLKPAKPTEECSLCGSESHLIKVDGITICLVCAKKVVNAVMMEA